LRSRDMIVLWPIYFDSTVTWGSGRRVPKSMAIKSPKTEDIVKAVISAGLRSDLIPLKAYPRHQWVNTGYVLVEHKMSKAKILRLVASKFPEGS
jgi:signal recognition particle subunit SRP19